jgi:hypothetical protein
VEEKGSNKKDNPGPGKLFIDRGSSIPLHDRSPSILKHSYLIRVVMPQKKPRRSSGAKVNKAMRKKTTTAIYLIREGQASAGPAPSTLCHVSIALRTVLMLEHIECPSDDDFTVARLLAVERQYQALGAYRQNHLAFSSVVASAPQPFVQLAPPLAQPAPGLARPAPTSRDTIPCFPS